MTPLKDWFDFRQSSPAHCECVVGLNGSESFWSARKDCPQSTSVKKKNGSDYGTLK
jgi:hypothetical protein